MGCVTRSFYFVFSLAWQSLIMNLSWTVMFTVRYLWGLLSIETVSLINRSLWKLVLQHVIFNYCYSVNQLQLEHVSTTAFTWLLCDASLVYLRNPKRRCPRDHILLLYTLILWWMNDLLSDMAIHNSHMSLWVCNEDKQQQTLGMWICVALVVI